MRIVYICVTLYRLVMMHALCKLLLDAQVLKDGPIAHTDIGELLPDGICELVPQASASKDQGPT